MPILKAATVQHLHKQRDHLRNICILAHVDHGLFWLFRTAKRVAEEEEVGKTTLSDSLLVTNGIISAKMAGKVRYLDSRADEQERGITMESSGISLHYKQPLAEGNADYLINLIDSPGHVDFAGEVDAASRLCDGALVLVDALEGVCTQTHSVLRQAWSQSVKPLLVINKIDRLITEIKLSPIEAHHHLLRIVEQVNAVMGTLFGEERMKAIELKFAQQAERATHGEESRSPSPEQMVEEEDDTFDDDAQYYFAPELDNVIFASAVDGWAFQTRQFADLFAQKLGMKQDVLRKVMWGDFYLDMKAKRFITSKQLKGRALKPVFVQCVLENLWHLYDATVLQTNHQKIETIITKLGLKVPPHLLKTKDGKALCHVLMTHWLPLSPTVLQAVVDQLPSPLHCQAQRMTKLFSPPIPPHLLHCASDGPTIVLISKMFSVSKALLPGQRRGQLSADEMRARRAAIIQKLKAQDATNVVQEDTSMISLDTLSIKEGETAPEESEEEKTAETLIAFARVFSGTLRRGQPLICLHPSFDPQRPEEHQCVVTVGDLYLLMGRDLEALEEVPAGNIVGIGGLGDVVLKSATLVSSIEEGMNMAAASDLQNNMADGKGIVRVAIEPENPGDLAKLAHGLTLLNASDAAVTVSVQSSGEHVICTAGELHLERCLRDLKERFAKIPLSVSKPIVAFRECFVLGERVPYAQLPAGVAFAPMEEEEEAVQGEILLPVANHLVTLHAVTYPLPEDVVKVLQAHQTLLLDEEGKDTAEVLDQLHHAFGTAMTAKLWPPPYFTDAAAQEASWWCQRIWQFGPNRCGANVLFNTDADYPRPPWPNHAGDEDAASSSLLHYFRNAVTTGFQLATAAGPLMAEAVSGMAICILPLRVHVQPTDGPDVLFHGLRNDQLAVLSGQLITSMKEVVHRGCLEWSPRLGLAMYDCDIRATSDVLGKVYAVLSKRRGKILSEEMMEGTSLFQIKVLLPVVESFGFADDIRKKTSGLATPFLTFSNFETLQENPFWVPQTEEELEDLGDKADRENVARKYWESVRERKGLYVDKKIVEHAEKQRTLKRNK